jgi:hypothetical protein
VVQAALGHVVHRDAGARQQRCHPLGKLRRAGGVVAQRVQPGIEAAEVVHGFMARRGQQHRLAREAVRRDREHGLRPALRALQHLAQLLHESAGLARLQRRHR